MKGTLLPPPLQNIEPELRACDHCLNNEVKCNRLAVIGVTKNSESRNAGGQRMLMEEKTGKENPNLNIVSVFPDAVHVAKRKRQSFSNWFLWVDDARVNLVQLRALRNDPNLYSTLSEKIPLSAVRNRDRQDVDSILQISDVAVTDALKDNAVVVTHTVVPEKYRITDDNKKGILKSPVGMTMGPLGNVFISDVETGKVVKVRASHYLAGLVLRLKLTLWTVQLELLTITVFSTLQSLERVPSFTKILLEKLYLNLAS